MKNLFTVSYEPFITHGYNADSTPYPLSAAIGSALPGGIPRFTLAQPKGRIVEEQWQPALPADEVTCEWSTYKVEQTYHTLPEAYDQFLGARTIEGNEVNNVTYRSHNIEVKPGKFGYQCLCWDCMELLNAHDPLKTYMHKHPYFTDIKDAYDYAATHARTHLVADPEHDNYMYKTVADTIVNGAKKGTKE